MNLVNYLVDIYGYDTPIFLKDIRIGRKSKAAIKEEFYRAVKRGEIERESNGIYFVRSNKEFGSGIIFEDVIENRFLFNNCPSERFKDLYISGYYSGLTFINQIGISEQVPFAIEITTNCTSSKKRYFTLGKRVAILRKPRVEINFQNYLILQFLDMFHFLTANEINENIDLIKKYIKKRKFTKGEVKKYLHLYSSNTINKIINSGLINEFE